MFLYSLLTFSYTNGASFVSRYQRLQNRIVMPTYDRKTKYNELIVKVIYKKTFVFLISVPMLVRIDALF